MLLRDECLNRVCAVKRHVDNWLAAAVHLCLTLIFFGVLLLKVISLRFIAHCNDDFSLISTGFGTLLLQAE